MSESGPEYRYVEKPLIDQLTHPNMGWRHVRGAADAELQLEGEPVVRRRTFDNAVLEEILRRRLRKVNRRPDGTPWVDDMRAAHAISALTRGAASAGGGLVAANEAATHALLNGVDVPGFADWDGGRRQTVRFIDWERPENNDFLAVSQFRMTIPGSQGEVMIADLVLFVNGIPLVVIECKKLAAVGGEIKRAVQQLRRYANQTSNGVAPRGSELLFRTVQLTVASTGDKALLGTFTARLQDYVVWRDPYPLEVDEITSRSYNPDDVLFDAQKVLAAGVLHPVRLLDIVKNFVVFQDVEIAEGRTARVKIAPRYQQYRAVHKAVARLVRGETKAAHGREDKRGGIVWHTQGSGKSLTMVFLVRKLRSTPGLEHFKVVVVTDRKQLQEQLAETAALTGEKPDVVTRASDVPTVLGRHGAGLVFVMIQKQLDTDKARQKKTDSLAHDRMPGWGLVNSDEGILILVDEAHRSHGSGLHQNLMESLPNSARIGFTGTPIIMNRKKLTSTTFGEFIDKYRIEDAENDGAIVPIFYEGHIAKGAVTEAESLDEKLEDEFPELTDEQYDELQQRYATSAAVLSAHDMIQRKARHMLRHYVVGAMKEGFKAQVVAYSRGIAVRYREALLNARTELVAEVEKTSPQVLDRWLQKPEEDRTARQRLLVAAHAQLALLKAIDFVPVISADAEVDDKSWRAWTDESAQKKAIKSFRSPFPRPSDLTPTSRPVAFLIVRTMLLTGFDAPREQVMYLDRRMREAELLQAVARVNRTAEAKTAGYIVDYAGVSKALLEAMAAYAADEQEGMPRIDFKEEENKLERQCAALRHHFQLTNDLVDPDDTAAVHGLVSSLDDEPRRIEYRRLLREFLATLNLIMPRDAARPYQPAARLFLFVAKLAKQRFGEDTDAFDPAAYGHKVAELIDEHVKALGVERMIEPTRLTSDDFRTKVEQLPGARAKASMMKHAIRNHIELHFGENPVAFKKLRERLENILKKYATDWDEQLKAFDALAQEMTGASEGANSDLPDDVRNLTRLEQALYQQLTTVITDGVIGDGLRADFVSLAHQTVELALRHSVKHAFWTNPAAQHDFQREIWMLLVLNNHTGPEADNLASALRDIVDHNQKDLNRPHA
ncbi:type I restriction endonuclease subunit R [Streptomyces asoensis]|uniref:Type I restriction enzyme endonuclease subunit n=1 Tax=Streptomyces asoensis TaxID=249586 RepID=A0A6M4WWW9_9ACTN|nr:HsdR family type I site-specific deoxyribonuclease [Streptomyces asoensis]QJT03825.1 type I restriction endonuclease subunit R [Streptomyces asoensis]